MTYIYDIVLNFNNDFYEFYEWDKNDNLTLIKKIPLIKVESDFLDKVFNLIIKHKLTSTIFKYKIIPGYYEEHYNTKELIEKHFTHFIPFEESEFTDSAIETNEKLGFKKFAFDSSTGKFVTDKVLFGVDYFIVNSNDINNETSVSINKTR